jgi:malto-oligosyltrehalose trehalohydrolase
VQRAHKMPFGAELHPGGATRFALWAPSSRAVSLWLETTRRALPMTRDDRGFVTLETRDAPVGTRYRFQIDGDRLVPDPSSRFQPEGVHGPSEVVDPRAFDWSDSDWTGLPAAELVFYELHVGTFTRDGTFAAAASRLDHLVNLGVTAVELMPVADFAGRWGWGYDGVLLFAPKAEYGRPEDLKAFVEACHRRGLAVFLDVVYNHFGAEGNYLATYAAPFFDPKRATPWGPAINVDGPGSATVRAFFVENALYWIEEFHLDGLRLDAVHAIPRDADPDLLVELASAVRQRSGRNRAVHLILENDENEARYLRRDPEGRPQLYLAQWSDDVHHALHVALTGETAGYYDDYTAALTALGRSLTQGFAYQGESSRFRGRPRGEASGNLPPTAFVAFLQNHDQVGNRALGERLTALAPPEAVRAATVVLLLAPLLPLVFMGQEWSAAEPFLFFSDLGPLFADAVREGRRREFARFPEFADPQARERIPDPQARETRDRSVLDWTALERPPHRAWLDVCRTLLDLRRRVIVPLVRDRTLVRTDFSTVGATALEAVWEFTDARVLRLVTNLGGQAVERAGPGPHWGRRLFASGFDSDAWTVLPPWSAAWYLSIGGGI